MNRVERLGLVFDRIRRALARAGIEQWKVYGIGDNGFAVVCRLESIEDDGRPKPGAERWSVDDPLRSGPPDLSSYLKALFRGKPGRYRVIVLIVTDRGLTQATDADVSTKDLDRLLRYGSKRLPETMSEQILHSNIHCDALVYEFYRPSEDDKSPKFLIQSHIQPTAHLTGAGLWRFEDFQR